jgi:nucleotide-binding universal stress UspA family protein
MEPKKFRKILIAVDGSSGALEAARRGADLAATYGAQVILCHCHKGVPEYLGEPYYQRMLDRVAADVERLLEPFREILGEAGVGFEDRVLEGDPARKLCEAARAERCDLVVLGTRGLSDLEGLLLGSVVHKVLMCAPCPVLAVR